MKRIVLLNLFLLFGIFGATVLGGPYREKGISSYTGPDHKPAVPTDPNAVVNPIFRGWATDYLSYEPTPYKPQRYLFWFDPLKALGLSLTDTDDVYTASLGDLTQTEIESCVPPGQITLTFTETIRDQKGYDFAVFENGFHSLGDNYYCELGYVEVSSNGTDFARFPSVITTGVPDTNMPAYYAFDITKVYNLAGKHPNLFSEGAAPDQLTGTPFNLSDAANEPNVLNSLVDLNSISYVRIVDIPGNGSFYDNANKLIDPCTWPNWNYYDANHPIYDSWPTLGSDGFDLEAIGVFHPQEYRGDIDLDGFVSYEDLQIFADCWLSHFGQENYLNRCDLANPGDMSVNLKDFAVFSNQWRKVEQWRSN